MGQITVNSRKYDQSIRRSWTSEIVEQADELIVVVGKFDEAVEHNDLGLIERGTVSYEYYWTNLWYSIFRFVTPSGELRNHYCNINMPPTFNDGVLDYVDLDIDVVVWPDGRIEVLDRDDFERNKIKYGYPPEVIENVEASLAEVLELIKNGRLP